MGRLVVWHGAAGFPRCSSRGVLRGPPLSERAATGVRSPGRHRPSAVAGADQGASPCTTFCDYQRLNGGTRAVTCPEGDGIRADEVQGNEFAAFAAEACLNLHASGRLFAFESSAPSGRYPKIWDLPCMRRLREQTGARLVPLHMCAWFLQPWTCEPGVFHKKPTWWLVSAELFPWVHLFISRHSRGRHRPAARPTWRPQPFAGRSSRHTVPPGSLLFGPPLSSGPSVPSRRCPSTSSRPTRLAALSRFFPLPPALWGGCQSRHLCAGGRWSLCEWGESPNLSR